MTSERRRFGSTYRLQLNGVGFAEATAQLDYLAALGIQTLYVSPLTRATAGSTHGYDVIDPVALDPAHGTAADFEAMLDALDRHGMSLLVDIVPNHMAASPENAYFADILRCGQGSQFADWFDVEWDAAGGRIVLPFLDRPLDALLDAGEISVEPSGSNPAVLTYGDLRLPLAVGTARPDGAVDAEFLAAQHYRLIEWRRASTEINYRRFFDINGLIGVRQEDPAVFAATHRLVRELVADERIAGVRVDHVDGLQDPGGYLRSLRDLIGTAPVILVEKILANGERLPADWPVDGTTGYEFATTAVALGVDPEGSSAIAAAERRAAGDGRRFADRAVDAKQAVLRSLFDGQVERVAEAAAHAMGVPTDDTALRDAVIELSAQLEVYRTYRRPGHPATIDDVRWLEAGAERARPRLRPGAAQRADDVLAILTGDLEPSSARADFAMRWQQLTSPATAKGVEDTAIYTPAALLALADVGSDPDEAADGVRATHAIFAARTREPLSLSALSTHDSKRSSDTRCRLAALSVVPERWNSVVDKLEASVDSDRPDVADRRYLYQTAVAVWPLDGVVDDGFIARIAEHMTKAGREAKRHTSWTEPDEGYERATADFVNALLTDPVRVESLAEMATHIGPAAVTNVLAAVVLRAAAPGVADLYQGDDQWLLTLVDPDNRRKVDAAHHATSLRALPAYPGSLLGSWPDGRIKQLVVRNTLHWRRTDVELSRADYRPLEVTGSGAGSVLAFARRTRSQTAVCIVPTRAAGDIVQSGEFAVGDCWADTAVYAGTTNSFTDVLTGNAHAPTADGRLALRDVLGTLPVALLSAVAGERVSNADDHCEDQAPPQNVGQEPEATEDQ